MTTKEFQTRAAAAVLAYGGPYTPDAKVECVWQCYILGNIKGLFIVIDGGVDGKYYEATYRKERNELYLDAYEKQANHLIRLD